MRPVPAGQVVAGEQRHHGEALHGHGQVLADHLAQLVGLALEAEDDALDLLVVLELGLEEPDHLDRRPGGAGDGHRRVAVGREDLLHGPVGDGVPLGGPPVAGHDDAVGEAQCHHRGAVTEPVAAAADRRPGGRAMVGPAMAPAADAGPTKSGPGSSVGRKRAGSPGLLATLLDVVAHELLGVVLEHLVDLVEQVVELRLQLLAPLPTSAGDLLDHLVGRARVLVFCFCSRSAIVVQLSPTSP